MSEKTEGLKLNFELISSVLSSTDLGIGIVAPTFIAANIHICECGCKTCFWKRQFLGTTPQNNPRLAMMSTIDGLLDGINDTNRKIVRYRGVLNLSTP